MKRISRISQETALASMVIFCLIVFLWPLRARGVQKSERLLTFSSGAAAPSLKLDREKLSSPVFSTAPHSFLNQAHLPARRFSLNIQTPELEPIEAYGAFFGLKITLKIKAGWNIFSGGNIEKGIGGMYDQALQLMSASAAPVIKSQKASNHSGFEVGGDLIYCLTPHFGIGIGASRTSAGKDSFIIYHIYGSTDDEMRIRPDIKVSVFRLAAFYTFPFAGRLAISVHGGPAFYFAQYIYNMSQTAGSPRMDAVFYGFLPTGLYQDTQAKQLGFEGGVGFEFNPNPFVAVFVEAQGRYARIGGFEGTERTAAYRDFHPQVFNQSGSLYHVDADQYMVLDIIPPGGSGAGTAPKATLDFSGFSLSVGLKFRL